MVRTLVLLASLALAACTTALSPETAFSGKDSDSIVIVGVRLLEHRLPVHSIAFVRYDPQTDESGLYGYGGFFAEFQNGKPKDGSEVAGIAYFIHRVEAGPYFLVHTGLYAEKRNPPVVYVYMRGKTALNVYCAINGLTNHDFDTKVSSLSSPRFELEPGKVHYIGDFELDGDMNLLSYGRRPENAAKALAAFPNVKGPIVQTRFQENFSLELKNRLWVRC